MTCERCEEIHEAQKEGKTQNQCKCECHDKKTSPTLWYNDLTGTTTPITGDDLYFASGTATFTNCNCVTSSLQCNDTSVFNTPAYPCSCSLNEPNCCDFCIRNNVKPNCTCDSHKERGNS